MILFSIYSFNSLCVNCFNSSFNWMYLSLLGFNAWYLWLLKFTMYALLLFELFNDLCNNWPYLSYAINETDGLLFSKSI